MDDPETYSAYVAPDGKEFEDLREYQNYMMETFYQDDDEDLAPYDASNRFVHEEMGDSGSEEHNLASYSVEEYIGDLKARASAPRPMSAKPGKRGESQGEIASTTFSPGSRNVHVSQDFQEGNEIVIAESVMIPSSPYDEEIAFEYRTEDDEDIDSAYLEIRRRTTSGTTADESEKVPQTEKDWQEENRQYLMTSTQANIPPAPAKADEGNVRPRPSSADPRIRRSSGYGLSGRPNSAGRLGSSLTGTRLSQRGQSVERRRNSSNTPLRRSRDAVGVNTSVEKLGAMKELLEDLVRSTVKKADLYHMIQVSLGFIDDYTLIPPRGAIITSKKKTWLTARDLQTAFMAARLNLSDAQVILLRTLVYAFAQQHETLHPAEGKLGGDVNQSTEESRQLAPGSLAAAVTASAAALKKGVFGPQHTLSSAWLKKYLVHLRLSKKVSSVSASLTATSTATLGATTSLLADTAATTAIGGSGAEQNKPPLAWTEWLGKKMQSEVKRDSGKPRDFEKALNGQPHALSKEDIEVMLKTYTILPPEVLAQEVECRIESWLLDMDGRRDFQHELNVRIRRWIWANKISKDAKIPKTEKGCWQIWQKLEKNEQKTIKTNILNTIIQEKRGELLSKERIKQYITKELYWKYNNDCQNKKEYKWKVWLADHMLKFTKDLNEFRKSEQERMQRLTNQQTKRRSVAGFQEIQSKLKKMQDEYQMDSYHQIELQKAINALRRTAMIRGVAKGTVITKEDFDKHIKGILAPYIMLDESGVFEMTEKPPTTTTGTTTNTATGRGGIKRSGLQGMFHQELKVAVDRVVELEKERTAKSTQVYDSWLAEKLRVKEEERRKKSEEDEKKRKEKERRDKLNKKEYKKWCSLHKKDQYRSRVDNKAHPLPEARTLSHRERWNADKELHEYYAEQEKRF